jgi:hypothetical protein
MMVSTSREWRARLAIDLTYRVHALVAPAVWRAKVAFALNRLVAATIECLVVAVTAFVAGPLDLGALIVMWHATRAVPVLDIGVVFVAPDAVEDWRRGEGREKGSKGGEGVWWRRWDVVEHE